jgi:2-aminoethylphosphonate-pyruvate transaminase
VLTGSGTAAVEAMLASFAPAVRRTLVIANGVYGERMARMLAAHSKPHRVLSHDWTEAVNISTLERALAEDSSITHVAVVHHETTTGRLNDLEAIGRVCRARGVQLLVDGVSSFGAERLAGREWNLAAVAASANKCLHGVPGLCFVKSAIS